MDALEAIKVVNWFWSKRLPNQLKKGKKITITGFGQFSPKRRLAITKKREYIINQIMHRKKNNYRKTDSPLRWKNDESRTRFDTYELG